MVITCCNETNTPNVEATMKQCVVKCYLMDKREVVCPLGKIRR